MSDNRIRQVASALAASGSGTAQGPTPTDTIAALATPPGVAGVAVLRISGPQALIIARAITGATPVPRQARLRRFLDRAGETIDQGLVLAFPAPGSFTGEDVVELQGHGGPVVQDMLLRRVLELGARPARPGEFSERAFLNDKLDLAQAEAIADLVASGSEAAARAAQRSLDGAFSRQIHELQQALTALRVFIEAALDFPDEEIDFIAESDVVAQLAALQAQLNHLLREAQRGQVLRDGVTVAILGVPNAGKSSLLNALAGRDSAIVTDIAGTTRDVLRETLSLDGLPVQLADTAGIRPAGDAVEAEGIRRAQQVAREADIALLVIDPTSDEAPQLAIRETLSGQVRCIEVRNKADVSGETVAIDEDNWRVTLSAREEEGLDGLIALLHRAAGLQGTTEGTFSARRRHLEALRLATEHLEAGREQLEQYQLPETLAEELRLTQQALGTITGEMLPDDLLGEIFSSFCIGK